MKTKFEKPLHLLIDGVDNVGKTTVINLLARKLDLPIIKMPDVTEFIKDGTIEKVSKFYNQTLVQFRENSFILDRGFTSSVIYSEVFGRKDNLDYINDIQSLLNPTIVILTRRSGDEYFPLCEDPVFNLEEKRKIDIKFNQYAKTHFAPVVNTYGRPPEEICNEILEVLRERHAINTDKIDEIF